MSPRWRWEPFNPDVVRVTLLLVPAIWGLSIDQINAYVDTVCASFLREGSVTALYNSNRLMQFALALFGTAVSTATLPHLARAVSKEDWAGMKNNLNYSLRLTIFAVLPAMTGLVVLAHPIVRVLFEHGRFTPENTTLTVSALVAYTLGLPAYSAVKILVSAFYAMKDTKTPVKAATWSLVVNVAGNVLLMWKWGVGGLAAATAVASAFNAAYLAGLLRRKIGPMGGKRILSTILRFCPGPLLVKVPAAVLTGTAAYMLLARAADMEEYGHVMGMVLRRGLSGEEGEE
jgi:putative peptidoglycan lipid II flippase